MYKSAEKPKDNKCQGLERSVAQKQDSGESLLEFVDNRSSSVSQRKIQQGVNSRPPLPHLIIQRMSEAQDELYAAFKIGLATSSLAALVALSKSASMGDFRAVVNEMTAVEAKDVVEGAMKNGFGLKPEVLPYAEWLGEIRNERLATAAEGMEGKLNWVRSNAKGEGDMVVPNPEGRPEYGGPIVNHFTTWLRGEGQEPTDTANMNCWEACLFAGYKAGVLPNWLLYSVYQIAKAVGQDKFDKNETATLNRAYADAIANVMGAGEERWTSGGEIPRGYMVFFDGAAHVAISRGTLDGDGSPAVMSLWCKPGPRPNMQATSVKKILDSDQPRVISYGPAPF